MGLSVDQQLAIALSRIEIELREKLIAGKPFSLQIEGVRHKIKAINTVMVEKTNDGKNVIYRKIWA